jgi:Holliday junction resolvase RusA-like endonuclease
VADSISFVVYGTPCPQGSMKAFIVRGRAQVTSDNKKLKPYRQEVAGAAQVEAQKSGFFAAKHVPVLASYVFYFERPPSIPRKRTRHVVTPDLDKLVRSTTDALTGILYKDDAQIVGYRNTGKFYGSPARVEITVRIAQDLSVSPTASKEARPCQISLLTSE